MRLTLVQTRLVWEEKAQNLTLFAEKLSKIERGETDLVLLPEMFTTGFSMNSRAISEPTDGSAMAFLRAEAKRLDAALVASFACAEGGLFFNRLVFVRPDGSFEKYDKRHLFSFAGEDAAFEKGSEKLIVEWRGWRICPQICYDLRFPVWSRNTSAEPFDLLIFIANWPVRRIEHWKTLLRARAIENLAAVAGLNIVGADPNGNEYSGDSAVVDFLGKIIWRGDSDDETATVELDKEAQKSWREKFPALRDADFFEIK